MSVFECVCFAIVAFYNILFDWCRYVSDMSDLSHRTSEDTRTASVSPLLPSDSNSNYLNSNTSGKTDAIDEEVDGVPVAAFGNTNRNLRRSQSTQQQGTRKISNTSYPLMHLQSTRGRSSSIPTATAASGPSFAGSPSFDRRLNDFLLECNCDAASRMAILNEAFTYEDFVFGVQKDDLSRIGLK